MLTEFFYMNRTDKGAQQLRLTYSQFPDHYVWIQDKKYWKSRQSGDSIGRIVAAHPTEGERYYLRILLSKVHCPTSFSDLKMCNGVQATTFREASMLRGYLADDNSQQLCLEEASVFHMPYELRRLFATLLVYACPNNPRELWVAYENHMVEDFLTCHQMTRREATRTALQQINDFLRSMGKNIHDFSLIPTDVSYADLEDQTREVRAEKSIIVSEQDLGAILNLNDEQKIAFQTIIGKVESNGNGAFFIDGPGGTGKTYLYRALLVKIRSSGHIALATATSGIAASILPGGRTAHSRFKIPLDIAEGLVCRINKQCSLATLIKECKLIIWDEAPMAKRVAIEALNDQLQDLMDTREVFGGKIVVLGGDFRQTLPVVSKGTKAETIAVCLTNSFLWPMLTILHLEENMRAKLDPFFTKFLLEIVNGTTTSTDDIVKLPSSMLIKYHQSNNTLNALIDYVYPNINQQSITNASTLNRAILTAKNTFVDDINNILIVRFPGEETEYISFDETIDPNYQTQYEDLLHSLTPKGLYPQDSFATFK
ncbi:uncharacterized protein [Rutidosis leptorrhynchoides]|uniref:uncharacterized protein isoform X2 n=1 Tax=Rutidosis leptorrhynchoides TaxID=125765 RepID=UPI003A9906E1